MSSLPIRERGSKPEPDQAAADRALVAPHPGARIETPIAGRLLMRNRPSLPIRERGSKLQCHPIDRRAPAGRSPSGSADRNVGPDHPFSAAVVVAPHPGARIETTTTRASRTNGGKSLPIRERGSKRSPRTWRPRPGLSLPIRERGSKRDRRAGRGRGIAGRSSSGSADRNHLRAAPSSVLSVSLPIRERGSKHLADGRLPLDRAAVAPHPGARIETPPKPRSTSWRAPVAPHPGARIETMRSQASTRKSPSRSPSGSADRNHIRLMHHARPRSRSPSGSANRNYYTMTKAPDRKWSLPIRERGSAGAMLARSSCGSLAPGHAHAAADCERPCQGRPHADPGGRARWVFHLDGGRGSKTYPFSAAGMELTIAPLSDPLKAEGPTPPAHPDSPQEEITGVLPCPMRPLPRRQCAPFSA